MQPYVKVADASITYDKTTDGLFTIDISNASTKIENTRFVKITMKGHKNWGFQILEAAVLSTEQSATVVDIPKCDTPKNVIVKSNQPRQLTYTITAGEGQKENGYQYVAYIDGQRDGGLLKEGSYTVTNLEAGTHVVEVYSYYNKLISEAVTARVYVDDGSLKEYVGTSRNLSKGCKDITVESMDQDHDEGSRDVAVLTDGKISANTDQVIETEYGKKDATITMDLGKAYDKSEIDEILIAFKEENTYAKSYTISFSADGKKYEDNITVKDAKYKSVLEDKFDASKYTQDTVRYVQIKLTDGNVNWGYQISEIAVMGGNSFMPSEPTGVIVESIVDNTIQVTWTGTGDGQSYFVYVDDAIKAMNLTTAGTYTYNGIDAGIHTVRVTSMLNDIESKGVSLRIEVKGETVVEDDEDIYEFGPDDEPHIGGTFPAEDKTKPGVTTKPDVTTSEGITGPEETTKPDATIADGETTMPNTTTVTGGTTKPGTTVVATTGTKVSVAKTKVKKVKKKLTSKKAKIKLKKINGAKYQVKISTTKKFKKKKTVTKKVAKSTVTIKSKKIKNKKVIYVKARAYKVVNGKTYFGKWSKVKKIKIKK